MSNDKAGGVGENTTDDAENVVSVDTPSAAAEAGDAPASSPPPAADTTTPSATTAATPQPAEPAAVASGEATKSSVTSRRPRIPGWLAWAGRGAVVILLIASIVSAVVFGLKWKHQDELDKAGQQARSTASAYAVTLTSVDPTKIDENFAAVLAGATGNFKKMYAESSAQLRQVLIDNKANGKGTVIQSAVKSVSENNAEILLFVDQSVTNTSSAEPRLDRSRILMKMQKVDGAWLASDVQLP